MSTCKRFIFWTFSAFDSQPIRTQMHPSCVAMVQMCCSSSSVRVWNLTASWWRMSYIWPLQHRRHAKGFSQCYLIQGCTCVHTVYLYDYYVVRSTASTEELRRLLFFVSTCANRHISIVGISIPHTERGASRGDTSRMRTRDRCHLIQGYCTFSFMNTGKGTSECRLPEVVSSTPVLRTWYSVLYSTQTAHYSTGSWTRFSVLLTVYWNISVIWFATLHMKARLQPFSSEYSQVALKFHRNIHACDARHNNSRLPLYSLAKAVVSQ